MNKNEQYPTNPQTGAEYHEASEHFRFLAIEDKNVDPQRATRLEQESIRLGRIASQMRYEEAMQRINR